MSEIDINKYVSGEMSHYTDPNTGITWHNAKFVQQLKEESENLCIAIRNELPKQYDKRVSEAESDIAWGILDRNATELEFCKKVIYETRNYIAKLEQENEELKNCDKTNIYKQARVNFEKQKKYKQCLYEIEHILEVNKLELDECLFNDIDGQILQKIKEVKNNEI